MNIETLMAYIKKRPGMFVGNNISLNSICMFINGFLYAKVTDLETDTINKLFNSSFSNYCIDWINKDKNLNINNYTKGYIFYIENYYKKDEQINIFFNICEEFFKDFHNNNLKYTYYEFKHYNTNIKTLIENMQKRPKMYIGNDISFDNIVIFLNGFIGNKCYKIDKYFRKNIHKFTIKWIIKNKNINVEYLASCGYSYYINNFIKKDERVDVFFNICNDFFKDYENK